MSWIDVLILAALAVCVFAAFFNGFLVEVLSLAGVVFGLLIAAAWYGRLAPFLIRWTENGEAANMVAFLLIVLGVMLAAGLLGRLLRGAVGMVGLGLVDRLLGAVFGFIKGCALVTLVVMAMAAFAPNVVWPPGSRLAPVFLAAAHDGSRMTAMEFGERIRQGVQLLRMGPPQWPARDAR